MEQVLHFKKTTTRSLLSASLAREKKGNANREKVITKLGKQIKIGKLTKAQINNKGYNKF